eukprot:scpid85379/ scgid33774/ 
MTSFNLLFDRHLCLAILRLTDNLSRTLQKKTLSTADDQEPASLTVKTLQSMKSSEALTLFLSKVENVGGSQLVLQRHLFQEIEKLQLVLKLALETDSTMSPSRSSIIVITLKCCISPSPVSKTGLTSPVYRHLEELLMFSDNKKRLLKVASGSPSSLW